MMLRGEYMYHVSGEPAGFESSAATAVLGACLIYIGLRKKKPEGKSDDQPRDAKRPGE